MSSLDVTACNDFSVDLAPSSTRGHRALRAQDLERVFDALHDVAAPEHDWTRRVAAAAARAFGGRSATIAVDEPPVAARIENASDVLHIVGHHDEDASVVLSVALDQPLRLSQHQRMLVSRVALHLENALRVRRRPDRVRGLLPPRGDHRERARGLWLDLLDGRATLAPSTDSALSYLVVDAPATWHARRALDAIERRIVTLSARGMTGKALAYTLGISTPAVSQGLWSAASKIGLRTTLELVGVAARLAIDEPPSIREVELTDAEREVLDLVRAGLSNRAIAERRGRSARTVANQIASLLRKTNSASRRTLAASSPFHAGGFRKHA